MPLQNRVTPAGDLIVTEARGTLMGNRGCLHDANRRIVRQYQGRRWIICRLDFRGRHHPQMAPGLWTSLFFLDEATALAAGHRPCAECQRARFNAYRRSWGAAAGTPPPMADQMDARLHEDRRGPRPTVRVAELPAGAMVRLEGEAWLIAGGRLLRWTPSGYDRAVDPPSDLRAELLTPSMTIQVIRAGYEPGLHPSAAPLTGA